MINLFNIYLKLLMLKEQTMRRILIVLSCLCLQSEVYAIYSEIGATAKPRLKQLIKSMMLPTYQQTAAFSSMIYEENKIPKLTVTFPKTQDPILQYCDKRLHAVMKKTRDDKNAIREHHEQVTNIEDTIARYLERSSYFKDLEGNTLQVSDLKTQFDKLFTQLALTS